MRDRWLINIIAIVLFLYCAHELYPRDADLATKIIHICKTGVYKRVVSRGEADRLAAAFHASAKKHNVSYSLLAAIGYYETVYRDRAGDGGRSQGIMQTGVRARRKCKCDMASPESQIDCGACWLRLGMDWCGSEVGGLTAYATGKCRAQTAKQKRIVNLRLRAAEVLK